MVNNAAFRKKLRLLVANMAGDATIYDMRANHAFSTSLQGLEKDDHTFGRIFILGCPVYDNLGDHAIALAERRFIEARTGVVPTMLYGPMRCYWRTLGHTLRKDDIICLQGGGNMGTLYETFENERLAIIDKFRGNRIILFPQTISFDKTAYDRAYVKHMARVYARHPDIHLVAREQMSFDRMREIFPKANVVLTPDIVLSLPSSKASVVQARNGLCLCLRADKERTLEDGIARIFGDAAQGRFFEVFETDTMHSDNFLSPDEGELAVRNKIAELSKAQLVVTDRIHGMIFCALSGTPCIALDNSNGKVGQEYEWLKGLPYIHFARSAEEAVDMIHQVDLEPGRFPAEDFEPLFEPIVELLPRRCHGQI